jgi:hypothetical protein
VRRPGLPSVDVAAFGRVARRTALVRAGLVLALVAALGAGAAVARTPEVENAALLPDSSSGVVVVLDASASVEGTSRLAEVLPDLYKNPNRRIRAALQTLVERDDPVGFVLFSDVAYEMLPLESPGRALAPLRRFFAPDSSALATGSGETFPENPWSRSFSGGTQISAGLSKALEIIERDATESGAILLLSDLDAPDDPDLAGTLARIRDAGVAMRIVSLVSDRGGERIFRRILGDDIFVDPDELERTLTPSAGGARIEDRLRAASPAAVILAGAAVLLLLALHERVLVRLPIPEREAQ